MARLALAAGHDVAPRHFRGPDTLAEGWRVQRDTPGHGAELDADGLRAAAAVTRRHRDTG